MSATTNQPRAFFGDLDVAGGVSFGPVNNTSVANPTEGASLMWNSYADGDARAELIVSRGTQPAGVGIGGLIVYTGPDAGPFTPVWSVDSLGNVLGNTTIVAQPLTQQSALLGTVDHQPIGTGNYYVPVGIDLSVVQSSGKRLNQCPFLKATFILSGNSDDGGNNTGLVVGLLLDAPAADVVPSNSAVYGAASGTPFPAPASRLDLGNLFMPSANTGGFASNSSSVSYLLQAGVHYTSSTTYIYGGYYEPLSFPNSQIQDGSAVLIIEPVL